MKMKLKTMLNNVKEKIDKIIDLATLRQENKLLKQQLEEERKNNQPLIDLSNKYKSENRVLKIQNTKLKKN